MSEAAIDEMHKLRCDYIYKAIEIAKKKMNFLRGEQAKIKQKMSSLQEAKAKIDQT